MTAGVPDVSEGDVVRMRRQHPCGGWEWRVFRVSPALGSGLDSGIDSDLSNGGIGVGLECLTCKHRVTLERRRFDTRVKARVSPASG